MLIWLNYGISLEQATGTGEPATGNLTRVVVGPV